jgi:ribonuclease HI
MRNLDVHTDGSCLNNGKPSAKGGWCFIIAKGGKKESIKIEYGKLRAGNQTNNRAELEAIYQALLWIDEFDDGDTSYTIYSDSRLVVEGIDGSSARNANRDIWSSIEAICDKYTGRINIQHIDSHNTDSDEPMYFYNRMADKLARKGANSLLISPVMVIEDSEDINL